MLLQQGVTSGLSLPVHHQIAELWRRVLGLSAVSLEDDFFELGGTEETALAMLRELEGLTGNHVALGQFSRRPTLGALADLLIVAARHSDYFVRIQSGRGGTPFYFFHGDILGGGYYARRLAELLGPDQAFYISPPMHFAGDELPDIEEVATRKRHALEAIQPEGPYILGGFCVGAVVAFEVARQLAVNGKEVSSVILIEPEIGDPLTRSHARLLDSVVARGLPPREKIEKFMRTRRAVERLWQVWRLPLREKATFVLRNTRKLLSGPPRQDLSFESDVQAAAAQVRHAADEGSRQWLLSAYEWMLASYSPKAYSGRAKVLVTQQHLEQAPHITEQICKAAPAAVVEGVPGDHLGCITTHLEAIARKVKAELQLGRSTLAALASTMHVHAWMLEMI